MSRDDWSGEIPSWPETQARAADDRSARRERILDWVTWFVIALAVVALAIALTRGRGGAE